eukprot:CAMPEP_0172366580 /NCGR_PEP_ID=MMETSP1060-20121228/16151_1 /TAXON_ID=37318 /ORGANISM="Pseudo-nitzschia pungens, Strain cf. cingulata" /LENGTH=603 /DNA_ID=CAMNT_0013090505 /DNA_START=193 /DNA_END=2004 /DNA_ORIENTATION=+
MAITSCITTSKSRHVRRPVQRNDSSAFRMAMWASYYCILFIAVHNQIQDKSCSAFSPLFTTSSTSSNHLSIRKIVARVAGSSNNQYTNDGIAGLQSSISLKKKSKKEKLREEDHSRWMSWMSRGSHTRSRHADEVRMREAEELGGVARSDRYSSRDWWHNTLSLPNSAILRAIRGPVLFMSCWAGFLSILYRHLLVVNPCVADIMCLSSTPHSLMSSALSLLLVFKTNSAYQRFSEGRKVWENITNLSRDMYRMINLYENEMGRAKRRRLQRLLAAFPYLLRHRIRPNLIMYRVDDVENVRNPENSIVLYQDKAAHDLDPELAAVATQEEKEGKSRRKRRPLYWVDKRTLPWRLLPPDAMESCARSQNRPLWVCDRMAHEIRSIPDGPCFTSRERLTLISKVEKLSNSIGSCERIHQTAVPLNYARHSLRALSIWLFTLPFCLVKSLELFTAPAIFLVSWLMFGIYEIGYSIEDPFQGTLRLSVLCDTIRRDVLADEVIRNTAFDTKVKTGGRGDKDREQGINGSLELEQEEEEQEYESSPIIKEPRQVLTVDEIKKKPGKKSATAKGSGAVVEELPVLPSKSAIWEGTTSNSAKRDRDTKRP